MRESDLGGEKTKVLRERLRENEVQTAQNIYIDPQKFSTDRGVKPSVEEGVKNINVNRCICREGVEE